MNKNFSSTVIGASLLLIIISILGKGIGFLREMIFAKSFGLSAEFDVFLISYSIPNLVSLVIILLGQNYFIPGYNHSKSKKMGLEIEYFNQNLFFFTLSSVIISVVMLLSSNLLIDFFLKDGVSSNKNLALDLFRLFVITIPFNAIISILSAHYQAEYNFRYPALSRLMMNIVVVLLLFVFSASIEIYIVAYAFVFGTAAQMIYLLWFARNKISFNLKIMFNKKIFLNNLNRQLLFTTIAELITLSYILVDRYFINDLLPGGLASLSYADVIFGLPIVIVSFSLSSAIFPKFSNSFYFNDEKQLSEDFYKAIKVNFMIFTPIFVILYFTGDLLISLLFQRGKFSSIDTQVTFNVLKIYSLSLVFYSSYAIVNKMIYSARLIKALIFISLLSLIVKIILNFVLIKDYAQYGLALSTSISYALLFFMGVIVLKRIIVSRAKNMLAYIVIYNFTNVLISYSICTAITKSINLNEITSDFVNIFCFSLLFFVNLNFIKSSDFLLVKNSFNASFKMKSFFLS